MKVKDALQIVLLLILIILIFPIIGLKIFDTIIMGIAIGLVISFVVILIWIIFNKSLFFK